MLNDIILRLRENGHQPIELSLDQWDEAFYEMKARLASFGIGGPFCSNEERENFLVQGVPIYIADEREELIDRMRARREERF